MFNRRDLLVPFYPTQLYTASRDKLRSFSPYSLYLPSVRYIHNTELPVLLSSSSSRNCTKTSRSLTKTKVAIAYQECVSIYTQAELISEALALLIVEAAAPASSLRLPDMSGR